MTISIALNLIDFENQAAGAAPAAEANAADDDISEIPAPNPKRYCRCSLNDEKLDDLNFASSADVDRLFSTGGLVCQPSLHSSKS
jgi:hypothetical protein